MVSIPRSGFCLFIPGPSSSRYAWRNCFNPSVGILFVHTQLTARQHLDDGLFQSLGRDSVCSYVIGGGNGDAAVMVSIPRSGFCLFILKRDPPAPITVVGFNPSVGILFVHTVVLTRGGVNLSGFQSLGRDSVCSYPTGLPALITTHSCFNPSVGILFVHT